MSTVSDSRDFALVLGDSHVYWLGRFVANSMVRFGSGPDFMGDNCRIRFNGFRGGSVDSLERVTSLLAAGIPRVIILAIGGNDIDSVTDHPLLVGMRVFELAKSLVSRGVERVVVTQVVHRQSFRHLSVAEGSRRVVAINEFLAVVCATEHIRFWKHKGMWNSPLLMFRGDGVHFNDLGNYKLWRSVRGAVFLALKGVHGRG